MFDQKQRYALYHGVLLLVFATFSVVSYAAEQAVQLKGGEYLIPGILSLPESTLSTRTKADVLSPSVLLLHGTASQKNEVGDLFQDLALSLQKQGIASLRIDFAGTGDSPVDYRRYTLSSARRDANVALDFLRDHAQLGDNVAVLGFSQGGLIAQQLVTENPDVTALVTWSTAATNGKGSFRRFFKQYYNQAKREGFASVSFPWLTEPLDFDLQWFEEIANHQTLEGVAVYPGPILAIAGSEDTVVPYQQSANLVMQSRNPDSELVLIDGADHIFNVLEANPASANPAILLNNTVNWIESVMTD